MPNLVVGQGNPYSKLFILGEAPGATEEEQGKPFVGASGSILNNAFTELGFPEWRTSFWTSNVYKYRPPNNDLKRISEVCNPEEQLKVLHREIAEINPNCILALGQTALKAVTGISNGLLKKWRGSILPYNQGDGKIVASVHPARLLRSTNDSGDHFEENKTLPFIWYQVLKHDIERAIKESTDRRLNLPERTIQIAETSADVFRFIRRYRGKPFVNTDIETFNSTIPVCVAIAFDKYESISIPLVSSINGIHITSQPTRDIAESWKYLDELWRNTLVTGQNFKFDQAKLEMQGFRFKGLHSDTSLKAHTVNPEIPSVSQGFLTSIYTREPFYKDEGNEFQWGKHPISRLFKYNGKDAVVDLEIDEQLDEELLELSEQYHTNLVSFFYDYVMKLHPLYYDMEKVGFKLDEGQRSYLSSMYETELAFLQEELDYQVGWSVNINAPQQIAKLIYDQMEIRQITKKRKTDADVISTLLKDKVKDPTRRNILKLILKIKKIDDRLPYVYMQLDYDKRVRTQVRIVGTETGRTSNSKLKEPVRPYESGLAFQTLPKRGEGKAIRRCLLPDDRHVIVNIDLSQAEARVVAVLAKDDKLKEAFNKIDVHRRMAACALITGKLNLSYEFDPIADVIGKDSPERLLGKMSKHATNYDMGWKRFMQEVITAAEESGIDIDISASKAKQILERIHAASPNTRDVFHRDIKQVIDTTRTLINPFGRLRRFFDRPSDQLYGEAYAFIPQSTVGDILKRAGLRVSKAKYPIKLVVEAHDALTYFMPINEYKDITKEIRGLFEKPTNFDTCTLQRNETLIIPCDMEVGTNYCDLEKVK